MALEHTPEPSGLISKCKLSKQGQPVEAVLCLGQDFWLNFKGAFKNSGEHTNSIAILTANWTTAASHYFLFSLDFKFFKISKIWDGNSIVILDPQ